MVSPSATSASGPHTAPSGDTSATTRPLHTRPDRWPSVSIATCSPRPAPSMANTTRDEPPPMPGPPHTPAPRITTTWPGWM